MAQCLQSIQLSFGVLVLLLADRFDPSASLLGIGKGGWICERLAEVRSRYQCETRWCFAVGCRLWLQNEYVYNVL